MKSSKRSLMLTLAIAASPLAIAAEVGPADGLRIEQRSVASSDPAAVPPVKARPRKKRVKKSQAPIPAPNETTAYDSRTSFEEFVKKGDPGRAPAAVKAKARVIALRRELGLTRATADQAPQDIVLSGGSDAGLQEGMILKILRKVPVLDPYRDNKALELEVVYGTVKVVHTQGDIAIARMEKMDSIKTGLAMGTRGVFVGDYVGSGD